jgi:2,3-dihydroxyphenylpropionate 1,2-dioxygenase
MTVNTPGVAVAALSHSPPMAQDVDHLQGSVFRAGFARLAQGIAAYDPTLVIYFGPDHLRALVGIAPCFTVVESATGYGDWGIPEEDYDVPQERAIALGRSLAQSGIDIATAPHLRLDHGFGQSTSDLFGSLSAAPMIPIVVNCIDRPLATAARAAALGTAVGEWVRRECDPQERVLVVASGGLSHAPPSLIPGARDLTEEARRALIADNLARAAEAINPGWDERFLDRLSRSQWRELAAMTAEDLAPGGSGGAEVRTWIAATFAGDEPLRVIAYEPVTEWITGMGIAVSANLLPL